MTGNMDNMEENPRNEDAAESVTLMRAEYETLLQQVKEAEALKDRLMRSAADYENAKKRLVRERDEFVKFSQESILRGLLPVFDNLERAVSHAGTGAHAPAPQAPAKLDVSAGGTDSSPAFKNLVTGLQRVLRQFAEILKHQGLVRIETVGKIFDPHVHESIGYVKEKGRDHEVLDEIESGYFLGEKLLRAAKVRVRISENLSHEAQTQGLDPQPNPAEPRT